MSVICVRAQLLRTASQIQRWPSQLQQAIGYLKHLCLAAPDDLQPRDGHGLYGNSSNALPHAVASHLEALVLKERSADIPDSMHNLLGSELQEALLKHYLAINHARRDGAAAWMPSYIRVPTGHLYGCIARNIQGQRFTTVNAQNFRRQLEDLGLTVGVPGVVVGVRIRSTVQLPTVQGLRWLIKKAGYLTDSEIALSDAPYTD